MSVRMPADPQHYVSEPFPRDYSTGERLSDAMLHLIGLVMALAAVPVLITLTAVWHGTVSGIVGVSVYGACLIAMLTASLAYNHTPRQDLRDLLRRIDMSAIYLLIAGTVTAFALLSGTGQTFVTLMWVAAAAAVISAFLRRRGTGVVSICISLTMGWAVLIGGGEVMDSTSRSVFVLIVVGGVLYSLGTPFLLMRNLRFHNTIWHGFVVVASVILFVAVFLHAAQSVMS
jgi:hemolysin III